ncbi:uncharacterized protein BXZ73DRAFT_75188 [Epithele typhae]|uniref:uncharacterized protein n=1 Tax=Epithele typhae TaxID=378194 RepID=UPI002007C0C8|nr:uncharacterized protein BXZ73DRAFT_75188 [Epithele typhae]KAH9941229.1 hypothetical protein BXZ73DRAFT_75188 [Epithele typhae]
MAHVMKPGAHGPYASNTFIPTANHGWVHAGYYASAPFNAAPPPVPTGMNPQTWMSGQWQPNLQFRPSTSAPPNGVQMWAPHPGWGPAAMQAAMQMQQQQQQPHNPFKRIPNPGDHTYWATQLTNNGLGLENMHIKDDTPPSDRHIKDGPNGAPHTPWVWVPKDLSADETCWVQQQGSSSPSHLRRSLPLRQRLPSAVYSSPDSSQRITFQASSRSGFPSAPATMSSYSSYMQQQQQRDQQQRERERESERESERERERERRERERERERERSGRGSGTDGSGNEAESGRENDKPIGMVRVTLRDLRTYTAPTTSTSSSASAAAAAAHAARSATTPAQQDMDHEKEAYSSRRELHTTFSPNIIRTPDHYSSPPSNRPSEDFDRLDRERTPSRSKVPIYMETTTPTPTPPRRTAPSRSNSISKQSPGTASGSSSSDPPGLWLGLLTASEEPISLLSPLVNTESPPKGFDLHRRGSSRSHTHPAPEDRNEPTAYGRLLDEADLRKYTQTPRTSYSSNTRTSPNEKSRSRAPSPYRPSHNPLPRPPVISPYTEQHVPSRAQASKISSSSASAAAAAAAAQQSSHPRRQVRMGFWNKRGDHLYFTEYGEKYVVYAPRALANPSDLKDYPNPIEGWRNHRGETVKYDPNVPELIDSRGSNPIRPYAEFCHMIDV